MHKVDSGSQTCSISTQVPDPLNGMNREGHIHHQERLSPHRDIPKLACTLQLPVAYIHIPSRSIGSIHRRRDTVT